MIQKLFVGGGGGVGVGVYGVITDSENPFPPILLLNVAKKEHWTVLSPWHPSYNTFYHIPGKPENMVQCQFVPDRCVPERKFSDDASLGPKER